MIGRYSKKEFDIPSDYKDHYKSSLSNGYSVVSVKDSVATDKSIRSVFHVKTPYMYENKPLYGYISTVRDVSYNSKLEFGELWVGEPNTPGARQLEDACGISSGKVDTCNVKDINGTEVSYKEALDDTSFFGVSASHYPHVMSYQEYMEIEPVLVSWVPISLPVNEQSYLRYLDGCEEEIMNRQIFIGDKNIDSFRFNNPLLNLKFEVGDY